MKILVVDDQFELLEMIKDNLLLFGWETIHALDGREAVKIFKEQHKTIDVVLLDQMMPVLDGIATLPQLLEIDQFATVVMMTSYGSINLATEFMRLGGSGFVEKPILNFDILKLRIEEAMRCSAEKKKLAEANAKIFAFKMSNAFISEFFVNFEHASRTPIHQISSFVELAKRRIETDPVKAKTFLDKATNGSNKLEKLLTLTAEFTRMQMGEMIFDFQSHFLAPMLHSSFAGEKNVQVEFNDFDDKFKLQCDERRIIQLFKNLFENAIKFSPDGVPVSVSVQFSETNVTVEISDQGPGIPEDELDAIFNPFFQSSRTTKKEGATGMGLAIAKGIVFGHCGKIYAKNNLDGIGATLTVILPINQK